MSPRRLYEVLLAWVVPGLGHLAQGRRAKAAYFGGLLLLMYGLGLGLGEGASVSPDRYPFHVFGQYLAGLPALVGILFGSAPVGESIVRLELGVVFTTVAGLLNLVVIIDVYEFGRRPAEGKLR